VNVSVVLIEDWFNVKIDKQYLMFREMNRKMDSLSYFLLYFNHIYILYRLKLANLNTGFGGSTWWCRYFKIKIHEASHLKCFDSYRNRLHQICYVSRFQALNVNFLRKQIFFLYSSWWQLWSRFPIKAHFKVHMDAYLVTTYTIHVGNI